METKQQKETRLAIIEALNLHGEVDKYDYHEKVKGGLSYTFLMVDGKTYYADITKLGVLSGYGSSRIKGF